MNSLSCQEPTPSSTLEPLTVGWSLARLRDALRSGEQVTIDRATAPFYDTCTPCVVRFAQGLIRRKRATYLHTSADADDVAVEAIKRALRFLVGGNGDRVRDELHFLRIVFRATRCAWADVLRAPDTRQSHLLSDTAFDWDNIKTADQTFWEGGKTAFSLIRLLFADGARFAVLLHRSRAGERHYRQYRVLVMYEIAEKLLGDLHDATPDGASIVLQFWRRLVLEQFCIGEDQWRVVEESVRQSLAQTPDTNTHLYAPIHGATREVCGADLLNRAKRHVLRHEMAQFFAQAQLQWKETEDD